MERSCGTAGAMRLMCIQIQHLVKSQSQGFSRITTCARLSGGLAKNSPIFRQPARGGLWLLMRRRSDLADRVASTAPQSCAQPVTGRGGQEKLQDCVGPDPDADCVGIPAPPFGRRVAMCPYSLAGDVLDCPHEHDTAVQVPKSDFGGSRLA